MAAKTTAPTKGAPGQTPEAPASAVARSRAALTADALVAALPNPTAVFAADGPAFTVLAANDALLASAGRPREAIVGRPLAEAFPNASPDDPAASGLAVLRASLETAVRTGITQRIPRQRYDLPRPDGVWEVRYWDAVNIPVPGPDGAVSYVLHQTEDVTAQVRSEQATARAERRAEGILERMADAHCVLDRDFRFVAVNAATERVLGRPRAALLGRSHWEVFPASVDSPVGHAYRRVVAEGVEQHVGHHYTGEGYDFHLEVDAYPTDEGGVAVFWRDVSDRVRADVALTASEERLRLAAAATGLGVFDWDLVTDRVTVNARFREMFGLSEGDAVIAAGMMGGVVHPEDRAFVEARIGAALDPRSSGAYQFEHRAVTPAGEIWLLTFGQVFFAGEGDARRAVRVVGNDLDVTERKHAEAERERATLLLQEQTVELEMQAEELQVTAAHLKEQVEEAERARVAAAASETRYRGLFASIDEGFCVIDLLFDGRGAPVDYRFVEANPALLQQAGLVDPVGRTARELVPGLEQQWIDTYGRVATTGESTRFELGSDAMGRWFNVFAFRTGRPEERRVAVLFTDVSAARAAERTRERLLLDAEHARSEAAAANQAKSGFLATMSHELRTPVNAVIGYAELLDLGLAGPLTAQQRDYLARLARSGHHLLGLVNDVLDLSKIEAGETRVAHADGMTGGPVRTALDLIVAAAAERGVRLVDARRDEAGVPFVGDEDRVRQVVVNLLSNAVKFTAPGGTVTVTCETVPAAPPAATHLRGGGPWALVRVADTGVGVAPEEQGRIFEPFHQVEGGHTRTAGGTGLGLAISRRLARLMGGDLSVESAPGVGSTFTLWLPAARHEAGQLDEEAPERSARAERDLTRVETPGLGELGTLLHDGVLDIIGAYTDRLRADPAIPGGAAMTRIQLEDHAISFLADLAQSLVIVGDAGPEAVELLKDGSAIQRAIAEAHGARRHAQGWDETALRRDQRVFREEVERAVRARLKPGSADVDAAVHVLLGLIDRGEGGAVRAWRRAAQETTV